MVKRLLPAVFVVLVAPVMAHAEGMRFNFSGRVGLTSFADAVTDQRDGTSFIAGYRPFAAISDNGRFLAGSMDSSMFAHASEISTCVGDGCLVTFSRRGTGLFFGGPAAQTAILDLDHRERVRSALGEWRSRTREALSRLRGDPAFWAAMKKCRSSRCTSVAETLRSGRR